MRGSERGREPSSHHNTVDQGGRKATEIMTSGPAADVAVCEMRLSEEYLSLSHLVPTVLSNDYCMLLAYVTGGVLHGKSRDHFCPAMIALRKIFLPSCLAP